MTEEWVLVLMNFTRHDDPEDIQVIGPITESQGLQLGEVYREEFPQTMSFLVTLQSPLATLIHLPTKGKPS